MFMVSEARFSECNQYRYSLVRQWDKGLPFLMFVMLNPSTADANVDDPTVKRCVRFSMTKGYGGLMVGNLFALRSTDPTMLYSHIDPVGPENNDVLFDMADKADTIVAAWGNHGKLLGRDGEVAEMFSGRLNVLKLNSSGSPSHPLYLPKNSDIVHWR